MTIPAPDVRTDLRLQTPQILAARAGAPGEAIYVTLKLVVTRFVPPFQGPRVEALLVRRLDAPATQLEKATTCV